MEIYVKHKESNKYGSVIGSLFIQHKWTPVNKEKYLQRKINGESLTIGQFIHIDPKEIDKDFYKFYGIIDDKEYHKCFYKDFISIK